MSAQNEQLIKDDRAHIIHPYLPASTEERVVMNKGKDCKLWDIDGKEYLDATGGLWLAQIGHVFTNKTIREKLSKISTSR